jgi:Ca2+-binding RTX toxin-like protein
MKPKLLLPLTALALLFGAPAAANAAVTSVKLENGTFTVNADGAADTVTISAVNGKLQHNLGAVAGLAGNTDFDPNTPDVQQPADDGALQVAVNAGDGNDTINLSGANLGDSTINGEGGDDIIVGSDNFDVINGGAGNDRITGFKNPNGGPVEKINGDDGNDVMIWNNGDGFDENNGGAGVDETLVTAGTADDDMTVDVSGTKTKFHRNNAPFDVDMDQVEKLSITSFSGNDKLVTGAGVTIPMSIDAGSGDDTITTGDGADVVNGGDGNDTLNGGNGGDRLVGDRGADTMNGGNGDDTTVWNNGDGSDVMNGDAGTDRVENNLGAGADVSTVKNENGRVRYDRTNVGPFSLSIATAEVFAINSLGGDDSLTVAPDVTLPLDVDAGDGNDTMNLRGVSADFAFGGGGNDTAIVDATDSVAGIEAVDRPVVAPAPPAGVATIGKTVKVKKGVASLTVSCPGGTAGCNGTVSLLTAKPVKLGRVRAQLLLGRASFALKAGETKTIKVKLASGAAKLAKKKKLAAVTDANAKVTLRF